jgi:hypothetical protein
MDNDTLQILLGRFDKLDAKIDGALAEHSTLASRVTAVETKIDPLVNDSTFKRRVDYVKTGLAASIGAGIVIGFKAIFPTIAQHK